ncbi:nucleoid-associated protein [Vagococcus zengguangii]|uniref:Nucleoid-associated protein n=1 Tax=Vagococcus zengguangii TaxID=2571750 RepID=A0A4D7CTG8_9ENTE|nr:nucleoid-associated protein [Vagococcus zengguangii]QCI86152.1 nucleoid-associated protein [Vagococcus zengguangii]TLG79851.1 nucleoid-associated protein [Vagococcus zengguangii]
MKIENAILHMLDFENSSTVLSQGELAVNEPVIQQYLDKLVSKFLDGDLKTGELPGDNEIVQSVRNTEQSFIEMSQTLANAYFDGLKTAEEVSNGDLLVVAGLGNDEEPFMGMFKLNYKPAYTHFVDYVDDQMVNNIIMNKAILPSMSQRVDEGIVIALETLNYQSIEKKYKLDGRKVNYLSDCLFEVQSKPSAIDNIKIVKKAVKSVADKYNVETYESLANVQQAIYESIEEDGVISNERIAEAVFENNHQAKQEYKEYIEKTNFYEDVPTNVPKLEKKFSKQKLKLANGIELFVPIEIYQDKEVIEFINNPDGTISVMIKNVEEIMNKF